MPASPTLTPTRRRTSRTGHPKASGGEPAATPGRDHANRARETGPERVLSYARWWGVLASSSFFFHVPPHISGLKYKVEVS